MEVNFANNADAPAATPVPTDPTPAAPAAPPVSVPATTGAATPTVAGKLVLGDRLPDFKDVILPRLNMAQNIGKLQENFENGAIVHNQKLALFIPGLIDATTATIKRKPTAPLVMIVLGVKPTRYVEKVKWGAEGGAQGLIVDSEEEVRAAGGTLDFKEFKAKEKSGIKRFEPMADSLVAVQRPEGKDPNGNDLAPDDGTVFNFEVEGKKYLLALWSLRGTCYTAAYKRVLFPARLVGCLKNGGYPSWTWNVTTREETWPGNVKSWIPVFDALKPSTAEQLSFVKSILGA